MQLESNTFKFNNSVIQPIGNDTDMDDDFPSDASEENDILSDIQLTIAYYRDKNIKDILIPSKLQTFTDNDMNINEINDMCEHDISQTLRDNGENESIQSATKEDELKLQKIKDEILIHETALIDKKVSNKMEVFLNAEKVYKVIFILIGIIIYGMKRKTFVLLSF